MFNAINEESTMFKHTATCPNGQIVKRNSANRRYTHVAVIRNIKSDEWKVLGWSSTGELARRNVEKEKSYIANLIKWNCYTGIYGDSPECLILEAQVA